MTAAAFPRTGSVVTSLLDDMASQSGPVRERLTRLTAKFVSQRTESAKLDWRYYLARYDCMREGRSGIYYGVDRGLGYEMTMLDKTVQRSYYRDPYLYAMWREAGSPVEVKDPWFYGYSTTPRWMQLIQSGVGIRSLQPGIAIKTGLPEYGDQLTTFLESRGDVIHRDDGPIVVIPQVNLNGTEVDTQDRVAMGARLISELISQGF